MDDLFSFLPDDQNRLIRLVYGLTSEPVSLQQASGILQVSYDNVRTLHRQVRERLREYAHKEPDFRPVQKVQTAVTKRGGVISHSRLVNDLQRDLANTGFQSARVMDLLVDCRCLDRSVKEIPALSAWALREKEDSTILVSASSILTVLDLAAPLDWPHLYGHLLEFPDLLALEEPLGFAVATCLQDNGQVQQDSDGQWWSRKGFSLADIVWKILDQAGRPLKLKDIQLSVLAVRQVSPRSVISAIEHDSRFSRSSGGVIRLSEFGIGHQKAKNEKDPYRRARIVSILAALGRPENFHTLTEIHNAQHPNTPLTPSTVRDLLLRNPSVFVRSGPQIFGLASWGLQPVKYGSPTAADRLHYILQQVGRPMHYQELQQEHNRRYPTHSLKLETVNNLLIAQSGFFVCLGNGIFIAVDDSPSSKFELQDT